LQNAEKVFRHKTIVMSRAWCSLNQTARINRMEQAHITRLLKIPPASFSHRSAMLNVLNDVRFTFSLAVALGDGLFEQPVGVAGAVHDFLQP